MWLVASFDFQFPEEVGSAVLVGHGGSEGRMSRRTAAHAVAVDIRGRPALIASFCQDDFGRH